MVCGGCFGFLGKDKKTRGTPLAGAGASPPGNNASDTASWKITNEDFERYRASFIQLVGNASGFLEGPKAKEELMRSGLPHLNLKHIWELADVNKDGRLSLNQFAVAKHLISRNSAGIKLPAVLPPELSRGVAAEMLKETPTASPPTSTNTVKSEASPWKILDADFRQYEAAFRRSAQQFPGSRRPEMDAGAARMYLEQYGLKREELKHIWTLSDVDRTGRLSLIQFSVASHLARQRSRGYPLPVTLPPELQRAIARDLAQQPPQQSRFPVATLQQARPPVATEPPRMATLQRVPTMPTSIFPKPAPVQTAPLMMGRGPMQPMSPRQGYAAAPPVASWPRSPAQMVQTGARR